MFFEKLKKKIAVLKCHTHLGNARVNNRKIVDDQNGGCGFLFSKYRVTKGS